MNSRIGAADALRGFSLFGIILANLLIFQYGLIGKEYISFYTLNPFNSSIHSLIKLLIEHSAMPIFTFLFGFSLIKLRDSLIKKGKKVNRHMVRRAFMLLGIGFVHAFFIWEGDILIFYGISCFLLLFFINKSKRFLLKAFVLITFIIFAASFVPVSDSMRALSYGGELTPDVERFLIEGKNVYKEGSYGEIRDFSANAMPESFVFSGGLMFGMYLLGQFLFVPMFLLGMLAAKGDYLRDIAKYVKPYRLLTVFIPIGVILKLTGLAGDSHALTDGLFTIGSFLLAAGYISLFMLLYHKYSMHTVMKSFEAVGKLSLTNYLLQSVIMTLIFYGYGLGMFGNSQLWVGLLIAISVYLVQVVLSNVYLKYFTQGPVEYVLRVGTYLSLKNKANKEIYTADKYAKRTE